MTYGYHFLRQRISQKDESGREVRFEYYLNGKPYKVLYPDGTYELYTYNSQWEVAVHTNTAGHNTSYKYDVNRTCVKVTDPLAGITQISYDESGRISSFTDANGGVGIYRNATTFGKSAVDFYVRHEGTFFTLREVFGELLDEDWHRSVETLKEIFELERENVDEDVPRFCLRVEFPQLESTLYPAAIERANIR